MKKRLQIGKKIVDGDLSFHEDIKYLLLVAAASVVHFCFTLIFFCCHAYVLAVYNIFATLFYIYHSAVSVKKRRYVLMYQSSLLEILFHSGFATLLLGTDFGFMIYTISLVPLAFYLPYTIPKYRKNIKIPVITSILIVVYYFVITFVATIVPHFYSENFGDAFKGLFYYVNSFIAFALLIFFSLIFMIEIYQMQARLEQENHSLGRLANYDPLTHLLNRRSMNSYLQRAWEDCREQSDVFTLIMSDIDDFKHVNDTYGHACGDEVLKAVSRVVKKDVRSHDSICRWGGEEILILVHADREAAVSIARHICTDVAERAVRFNGQDVRVTLTLGIASYHGQPDISTIIAEADANLYKGKTNGKNQVVF
ncbi:MAG: GGDEF domain-containing protein [Blautia sp.]|nr:GGDEF domain-containing protein [Blautia sp.]